MKKRWDILLIIILLLMLLMTYRWVRDYRVANAALVTLQQKADVEVTTFVKAKAAASDDMGSLKAELDKVEKQLKEGSQYFPTRFNEIEVSDYILEFFSRSGTEPVLFQPLGVSTETIGKGSYLVYKYQLKARGTSEQIKTFIADMEKNPYPAFRMDLVDVNFSNNQMEVGFQLIFIADSTK